MLEHLRYRTDRAFADAAKLIADFRPTSSRKSRPENVDGGMLVHVGEALHQAKSLPRRHSSPRQHSSSSAARTDRFRPTPTPLLPESSTLAAAIRSPPSTS